MTRGLDQPPHAHGRIGVDPATALADALDRSAYRTRVGLAAPARVVQGSRTSLWDVISRLRRQVRNEVLSLDDTNYLLARGVPEEIQQRGPATLRAALDRGAVVHQVTSRAGLLADHELGAIVYRAGGKARVVPNVPFKMSVLDRRLAVLAIDSTVLADGFQVVRDPGLVTALVRIHRDLWTAGADPDGADGHGLPPQLAALLPTLASGEPDDSAARRLGISPRTYSRRVADLLTLLGVRSRFQAGAEAARRGWL
ncbi:helix-turn-helix transcriptional regulator [Flindersiella endophytica]